MADLRSPATILRSWTFGPGVVLVVVAVGSLYLWGAVVVARRSGRPFPRNRRRAFLAGWIVLGVVIAEVPSNADGTKIRFTFPTQLPMGGGAALKPGPGSHTISVSVGALTSNSLTLEVR